MAEGGSFKKVNCTSYLQEPLPVIMRELCMGLYKYYGNGTHGFAGSFIILVWFSDVAQLVSLDTMS